MRKKWAISYISNTSTFVTPASSIEKKIAYVPCKLLRFSTSMLDSSACNYLFDNLANMKSYHMYMYTIEFIPRLTVLVINSSGFTWFQIRYAKLKYYSRLIVYIQYTCMHVVYKWVFRPEKSFALLAKKTVDDCHERNCICKSS